MELETDNLSKLRNLSKYLTHLESELSSFWLYSPALLCIIDPNTLCLLKTNPAWTTILGHNESKLKDVNFLELTANNHTLITKNIFGHLIQTKEPVTNFVNKLKHLDGTTIDISWVITEDPVSGYIFAYGTSLKELSIQKNKSTLAYAAIENCLTPLIIVDHLGVDNPVIYVNPAFEEITQYPAEEIIGKNCRVLQGTEKNQAELEKLRTAISSETSGSAVVKNFKKNGEMYYSQIRIAPIKDTNGTTTHFVGSANIVDPVILQSIN